MWNAIAKLLGDTGAARPVGASPWDRWIALSLAPVVVAEALLREGLALRPMHVAVGFAMLGAVVVRRARPFAATALGFGLATAWSLVLRALGLPATTLEISAFVLLLPYSLVRWGSAREVVAGVFVLAGAYASAALHGEMHGLGEAIGAAVVILFPGALGASARFRANAHAREVEHAKLQERTYLARDLHDTVAHHVAAIAIQAQAGRAVLAVRPEASASSLEAIEREAARTLAEPLTDREEEVLLAVARGRTNQEIAGDLHVSLSTVKSHLANLMGKLGARNRVEIAMFAYETGRVARGA